MYRIIQKFYGELCDKEKKEDEEVYDEDIYYETDSFEEFRSKLLELVEGALKEGYVIDKQEEDCLIRLFYGKQENWQNYFEIILEDTSMLSEFISDFDRELYIKEIIEQLKKEIEKLKKHFIESCGRMEGLISEMSLLIETCKFFDNEKSEKRYTLEELNLLYEYRGEFIDELTSIYYNSELGNSYTDINYIVKEFIREFTEIE